MDKGRINIPFDLPLTVAVVLLLCLIGACAMPQVIILEDTLTAEEHNDLGVIYEKKGLADLAEKEYLKASRKRGEWMVPYFNLGNLCYKRGDYGRSESFFREALERAPGNPDVMNNLANALLMQGRLVEARKVIEEILAIDRKEEYLDTYRKILEKESRKF
jgi:Flp pilus assembly protein TadD